MALIHYLPGPARKSPTLLCTQCFAVPVSSIDLYMSVLSVQIGQCGNQLGAELFRTIHDDCFGHKVQLSSSEKNFKEDSLSTFFHENVAGQCI
ncbi:tubulin delta [Clonorchis sinensis]|uniref:Tubulin delta n=1 Tax=Clonorchis sinensis TaxID=79923 RepID=G7YH49_CLOSI|nr:tubulin delta [Clonorchis sinensis]